MRDILNRQADGIEYVLRTHGIDSRVEGGKLSPRLAHFQLAIPEGVRPAQVAAVLPEVASELGVASCRLTSAHDGLYIEVARPDPVPVRLMPLVQRVADVVPPATATLGLDGDGTPLLLRLHSPDVDPVLVSGLRGSGKSSLLRSMALSLSLHNSPDRLRLLLLDCAGEGAAFRGLEDLPHHACPVAYGPVEALAGLRWALRALSRRMHTSGDDELTFEEEEEGSPPSAPAVEEPALVIMIDGLEALCYTGNRRVDAEAADAVARLVDAGNRHGIHLVVAAEQPEAALRVSAGWRGRIVGAVESMEEARVATGLKSSGAQHLLGSGDFLVALNSELIRFQAGAVSDTETAKACSLINAATIAYSQPESVEPPDFTARPHPQRPQRPHGMERPAGAPTPRPPVPLQRRWSGE